MTRCPHCGKDFDETENDLLVTTSDAEEIYKIYPLKRRMAKQKTIAAIKRALKVVPFPELKRRVYTFAIAWDNADMAYCPTSAVWFGQGRYNDDPSTWAPQRKAAPSGPPLWKQIEQLEKAIETHPANPRYVGYRSDTVTPAMREELKGLRAKLAELQKAQLQTI